MIRICRNIGPGNPVNLVIPQGFTTDQLLKWREKNIEFIREAKHLIEDYNEICDLISKSIDTPASIENKLTEAAVILTEGLNIINSKLINNGKN